MRKILSTLVLVTLLLGGMNVSAEVITRDLAKATADNLLCLDEEFVGAGDAAITLVDQDGVPAYYVIEYVNGGWAVIAAQSSAKPLIAYNPTGKYEVPLPMQEVLDFNKENIVEKALKSGDERHIGWSLAKSRKPAAEPTATPDIAPLIKVNLNQGDPYNKYCPSIGGQKTLVGCVAVGMGQAMMVARYPDRPEGKYQYTHSDVGVLAIDYNAEEPYDWDAMYAQSTKGMDEIARLLYHCGVSVNMGYGVDGSGTYTYLVAEALPRNFKYDRDFVRHIDKPENDRKGWIELLLDELVLGRVIVYHGSSDDSGHCWNIDGWKQATQMFHVDWGWGAYGNAYFDIDAMEDKYQGTSFPYNNGVVIGVGAPTTAPYGLALSTTTFYTNTNPDVALADVKVACEDANAAFEFKVEGPKNMFGKYTASPYKVEDMKLVSTETIADATKFKFARITVTNTNTGESFTQEFNIVIKDDGAVESAFSNNMRVYPTIVSDVLTVDVPAVGGKYAIYSMTGAQVAKGDIDNYTTQVSVSTLPAGNYILRYVHDAGVGVKTFIVK